MAENNLAHSIQRLWELALGDLQECHKVLKQVRADCPLPKGEERDEFKNFLKNLEMFLQTYYSEEDESP